MTRQYDEIEALSSIYGENWQILNTENRKFSLKLNDPKAQELAVELHVTLPDTYPSDSPPTYEIVAPWLKGVRRKELMNTLETSYLENIGECVIYTWSEAVRDFLQESTLTEDVETEEINTEMTADNINCEGEEHPDIFHGEPMVDRKSVFQAHVATVSSVADVEATKTHLLRNRKISNATHNIVAYRIKNGDAMMQDCDDDGEHAAGGRLLHLLEILDVKNVLVIVSRWYGGIQLGPDRFKHINNVARNVLQENGFMTQHQTRKDQSHHKKGKH